MKSNTKLIVLLIVFAVMIAVALVLCAVVLPVAFQARREAARREQTVNNLKQIGEGLKAYTERKSPPKKLELMATVKPDTEFRLYRRRPEDNHWDDGSPFDQKTALTVLDALATATPWDANSHAAAYGMHAHAPGLTLDLSWCKDMHDDSQRETQSVCFCYGNWLFWHGNTIYQVSEQNHDVLNDIFPENK